MIQQPKPDSIFQLGMGFWNSKAFLSAVDFGVFSELAKGPAELHVLRDRLGLHPRSGGRHQVKSRPRESFCIFNASPLA